MYCRVHSGPSRTRASHLDLLATRSTRQFAPRLIRISNLTLARGAKRLLEGASLTVHAGTQGRARRRRTAAASRASSRCSLGELHAGRRRGRAAAVVDHRACRAGDARRRDAGDRVRAGWRPRVARGRGARSRRRRPPPPRSARRGEALAAAASPLRRDRRLRGARARGDAARRPRLSGRAARRSGGELFRRLADAAQPRAGADVPLGPAAARRAHQSPRPRRRALARGLARPLSGHAAAHHARPRLPRRRRRRRSFTSTRTSSRPTPATIRSSSASARCSSRCSRRPTRSSSARSRICSRSSTAFARRRPRRSRRRAGSRRSSGWSGSPPRTSTARSSSRFPPVDAAARQLVRLEHATLGYGDAPPILAESRLGDPRRRAHRPARPERRGQVDAAEGDRRRRSRRSAASG